MNQLSDNTSIRELVPVSIENEMKKSYLDYAMSVIVSRAIPDVRDGMKPVHRRILYTMHEMGCDADKPYRKSARIVGDVMGKYHPHGDSAIYDALVRMAQDFSMGTMLVDGQGNFGSLDADPAAAMRYTEARLAKVSHSILEDLDKETVDFQDNYDGSEQEPTVLPARFPNILVNGGGGIAVGMATNIPPHNLGEIIDATIALINNPEITDEELLEIVPGPDFPTAGQIVGRIPAKRALISGRGSVIIRARAVITKNKQGREIITFADVPYQVIKSRILERIGELVREKKIEGISEALDLSNSEGVCIQVEVKRDHQADIVLNQLYQFTPLQSSFSYNTLVLSQRRPKLMGLREILSDFIVFREEVVTKRTRFLLRKARERAHILIGLATAVANIDEVITLIKSCKDGAEAREKLCNRFWDAGDVMPLIQLIGDTANEIKDGRLKFTEAQARAILDLRLQRLTGLERDKIDNELKELAEEIKGYIEILSSRTRLREVIKGEMMDVRTRFAVPRRTEIIDGEADGFDIEDLIQREEMAVTVTHTGYIKRVPLSTYRAQRRGGKGRSGMTMREEDVTTEVFVASTHTPVLFFSNVGKVYRLKVYKLPVGTPQSKGKALVNLLPLAANEKITTFMPLPEDDAEWANLNIFFSTSKGNVRRNDLSDFHNIQSNGKIAIRLEEGDKLVNVATCMETDHILLATQHGKCVRFPVDAVRVFKSRTSDGVRGMKLEKGDEVNSMTVLSGIEIDIETRESYLKMASVLRKHVEEEKINSNQLELPEVDAKKFEELAAREQFILTITSKGYGKRTSAYEYRVTNRGGSGIINIECTPKNGEVVTSFPVMETDEIMLMTNTGRLFRTSIASIRITGRNTQGVIVLRAENDEQVVSAVRIVEGDDGDDLAGE